MVVPTCLRALLGQLARGARADSSGGEPCATRRRRPAHPLVSGPRHIVHERHHGQCKRLCEPHQIIGAQVSSLGEAWGWAFGFNGARSVAAPRARIIRAWSAMAVRATCEMRQFEARTVGIALRGESRCSHAVPHFITAIASWGAASPVFVTAVRGVWRLRLMMSVRTALAVSEACAGRGDQRATLLERYGDGARMCFQHPERQRATLFVARRCRRHRWAEGGDAGADGMPGELEVRGDTVSRYGAARRDTGRVP